jgi:hypothetical protein
MNAVPPRRLPCACACGTAAAAPMAGVRAPRSVHGRITQRGDVGYASVNRAFSVGATARRQSLQRCAADRECASIRSGRWCEMG